ncbi:MAG TPA: ATP-binding protein [Anaeromyxobacteraceae bacterium]|nr:ATP-binding protein [Anaeromyxobacteraceae bacterium]
MRPPRPAKGGPGPAVQAAPAPAADAAPDGDELLAAFACAPSAAALLEGDSVVAANQAFAQALGLEAGECRGRRVLELLRPEAGSVELPGPGGASSWWARIGAVRARVEARGLPEGRRRLTLVVVAPQQEGADTAASRALLQLSRALAGARSEEDVSGAVARALELLFPGRSYCVRLLDAGTLTLTTLYARGRLKEGARERLALKRAAVRRTGLSEEALEAGGVRVVERDETIFQDSDRALAVPLATGGQLFGLLHLEYPQGAPGDALSDGPLLLQVANQSALGVRNLRSIEELTYLKSYLEDLIENANALIVVVNRRREVTVFNRALSRLTGWSGDEAMGQDLLSFVGESERERLEQVLARSLEGDPVTSFETRILLRAGGEAQVAFNTSPVTGAGGETEGVVAIGQDLTQLRAMEERAEHYQRLAGFGRLAAGIVHELKNPLVAIVSFADALLLKYRVGGLDQADVDKLRRIREAGERLERFSRDLVTYARPSPDKAEPVDLVALLVQAARMCDPALREAGGRVMTRFDGGVPVIRGVKASLLQVFVNLVTNAAQALSQGGTITLGLAAAGDGVAVRVTDDGRGMTPEVRRRVFEPFFTTKPGGSGSGLGLSIVQGIVARHGGAITVDSDPGQGTTVTVLLPRQPPG